MLLLGRQDYIVRSVHADSRTETWNATYSRLVALGSASAAGVVAEFLAGGGPGRPQQQPGAAAVGAAAAADLLGAEQHDERVGTFALACIMMLMVWGGCVSGGASVLSHA